MAKTKPSDSAAAKKRRESAMYTQQRKRDEAGLERGDANSARELAQIDRKRMATNYKSGQRDQELERQTQRAEFVSGGGSPNSPLLGAGQMMGRAEQGLGQIGNRALDVVGDPAMHGPQALAGASVAPILARLANGARESVAGAAGPAMQRGGQAVQGMAQRGGQAMGDMAQRGGQAVQGAMQHGGQLAREAGQTIGNEVGRAGQMAQQGTQAAGDAMHPVVQQITSTLARMEQRMMAMEANAGQSVEGAVRGVKRARPADRTVKASPAGSRMKAAATKGDVDVKTSATQKSGRVLKPKKSAAGRETYAVGPKSTPEQEAAYRARIASTMKKPGAVAAKPAAKAKSRSVTATERGKTVAMAQKQTGKTPVKGTVAGRVSRQTGEYTPRGGAVPQKAKGARPGAPRLRAGATAGKIPSAKPAAKRRITDARPRELATLRSMTQTRGRTVGKGQGGKVVSRMTERQAKSAQMAKKEAAAAKRAATRAASAKKTPTPKKTTRKKA